MQGKMKDNGLVDFTYEALPEKGNSANSLLRL